MPTIEEVINFILTTEKIEDLPTIGDALNERFATEIGLVADRDIDDATDVKTDIEDLPPAPATPAADEKAQAPLPPFSL